MRLRLRARGASDRMYYSEGLVVPFSMAFVGGKKMERQSRIVSLGLEYSSNQVFPLVLLFGLVIGYVDESPKLSEDP